MLEQISLALAIAMAGAILLLLIGTAFLDWYWIALVTAIAAGVAIWRMHSRVPSKYRIAQTIDRRLKLADALSTATYFEREDAFGDEAIRARQREEAESIARGVDARAAVPFTRPRFIYAALGLAAVAGGLFALRFAVTGTMSLQPSLAKIAFDTFFPQKQEVAKNQKWGDRMKPPVDSNDQDTPTTQDDKAPDSTLNQEDQPDYTNPQSGDNAKDSAKQAPADTEQSPDSSADKGDKQQNGNEAQNDADQSKDAKGGNQKNAQDSKNGSNDSSSLMDKLKDALSNMMNKMKPSNSQNGNQSQQQQNAQKDGQSGQQKSNQKGQQAQKQAENADAQSDQSDQGDKNQSSDAKGAEKSSDKNASQDSKSGIGSADGDKAAREAEQLQAMGKITEIFGKRAQNVQGEVMVEVGSSKQQLKTPWSQKQATHSDAGSEIHRDEVPLIYQQFVEQYFEQIHKPVEGSKAKAKN